MMLWVQVRRRRGGRGPGRRAGQAAGQLRAGSERARWPLQPRPSLPPGLASPHPAAGLQAAREAPPRDRGRALAHAPPLLAPPPLNRAGLQAAEGGAAARLGRGPGGAAVRHARARRAAAQQRPAPRWAGPSPTTPAAVTRVVLHHSGRRCQPRRGPAYRPAPRRRSVSRPPPPPPPRAGHFLLGPHWAQGTRHGDGHWQGAVRPVLIDHAASFRWGPPLGTPAGARLALRRARWPRGGAGQAARVRAEAAGRGQRDGHGPRGRARCVATHAAGARPWSPWSTRTPSPRGPCAACRPPPTCACASWTRTRSRRRCAGVRAAAGRHGSWAVKGRQGAHRRGGGARPGPGRNRGSSHSCLGGTAAAAERAAGRAPARRRRAPTRRRRAPTRRPPRPPRPTAAGRAPVARGAAPAAAPPRLRPALL